MREKVEVIDGGCFVRLCVRGEEMRDNRWRCGTGLERTSKRASLRCLRHSLKKKGEGEASTDEIDGEEE